jgi:hypothetical protein
VISSAAGWLMVKSMTMSNQVGQVDGDGTSKGNRRRPAVVARCTRLQFGGLRYCMQYQGGSRQGASQCMVPHEAYRATRDALQQQAVWVRRTEHHRGHGVTDDGLIADTMLLMLSFGQGLGE